MTFRMPMYLGSIQLFVAIGALPAGLAMLVDPSGSAMRIPLSLLDGSPFGNYFIPGLFLFTGNGLGQLVAALLSFREDPLAGPVGLGVGVFLVLWIAIQGFFIGLSHWLQVFYLFLGVVECVLAVLIWQKHRGWGVR